MGKYRIEIIGGKGKATVNVEGCVSIEKYTKEKITVKLSDYSFSVSGKDLAMPILVNNNLCICGYVRGTEIDPILKGGEK